MQLVLLVLAPALVPAFAQAPDPVASPAAEPVRLRVAVDDRRDKRLQAPTLEIRSQEGIAPAAFRDDGTIPGDVPADRILLAQVALQPAESVRLIISDEGQEIGSFEIPLPVGGLTDLALKTRPGESPLVVDSAAPAIAEATAGTGGDGPAEDRITIRFVLDDRALALLQQPRLLTDQQSVPPIELLDDGSLPGDEVGDRIWQGVVDVGRAQYLGLTVEDAGREIGELSVFLPSSSEAEVRVQTVEGEDGLRLVTEPTGTSTTDAPSTGTAAAASPGEGRLAHILWVGIALFAMAFAYIRSVVQRRYEGEVRPLMKRLERFLDEQERSRPPGGEG